MLKHLRRLTDTELKELMDVVFHEALVEEVRHRLKKKYEEMAYSFYNNEYNLIGNITELTEVHSEMAYNEFNTEVSAYITEELLHTPHIEAAVAEVVEEVVTTTVGDSEVLDLSVLLAMNSR